MTGAETTFRKSLLAEISTLAGADELDDLHVQMGCIEEKKDVLGELLDYYTDELLRYKPFADEFNSVEIERISDFLKGVREAFKGTESWAGIKERATALYRFLEA
jgi:hypothetical protein